MPALDIFHDAVKRGLEKEGWQITADPLLVRFSGIPMYIDLGAEKVMAAEKEGQRIAVEIKSFVGPSTMNDFHTALGQFLNYRLALSEQELDRVLYLAVPDEVYADFFSLRLAQVTVKMHTLRVIVYNAELETIVQWIN